MNIKPDLTLTILSLLLFIGCSVFKQNNSRIGNEKTESNTISFLMLNIHRDSATSTNVVKFVSKKESPGKIKKQGFPRTGNNLIIYFYSGKQLVDSAFLEHPLYKHIEYADEHNQLSVKDTVIHSADFFVRMQGHCNELKIIETLHNKLPKQLNTLKL